MASSHPRLESCRMQDRVGDVPASVAQSCVSPFPWRLGWEPSIGLTHMSGETCLNGGSELGS